MNQIVIRDMINIDWNDVAAIYKQGIDTGTATFQSEVPSYDEWDRGHIKECRLVAILEDKVVGWIALSAVSSRYVYRGVAELSIYIDQNYRGMGVGSLLMETLIKQSEEFGYWTLQSGILEENERSLNLHIKHGFRVVGFRERIGKTHEGIWKNTILVEKRSNII
jgi:phosphinothricin acetyltransferase